LPIGVAVGAVDAGVAAVWAETGAAAKMQRAAAMPETRMELTEYNPRRHR